jgi:hypothetical protein
MAQALIKITIDMIINLIDNLRMIALPCSASRPNNLRALPAEVDTGPAEESAVLSRQFDASLLPE